MEDMKERILKAMQESKNETMFDTSVIFVNCLTDKVSFYNGLTEEFEPITKEFFNWLIENKYIERQKCICQGDTRYIAVGRG